MHTARTAPANHRVEMSRGNEQRSRTRTRSRSASPGDERPSQRRRVSRAARASSGVEEKHEPIADAAGVRSHQPARQRTNANPRRRRVRSRSRSSSRDSERQSQRRRLRAPPSVEVREDGGSPSGTNSASVGVSDVSASSSPAVPSRDGSNQHLGSRDSQLVSRIFQTFSSWLHSYQRPPTSGVRPFSAPSSRTVLEFLAEEKKMEREQKEEMREPARGAASSHSGTVNHAPRSPPVNTSRRRALQQHLANVSVPVHIPSEQLQPMSMEDHDRQYTKIELGDGTTAEMNTVRYDNEVRSYWTMRNHAWLHQSRLEYILRLDKIVRKCIGVPRRVIAMYPARKLSRHEEATGSCAVCCEEFEIGDRVRCLSCLHVFHEKCIDRWLAEHDTCVLCKVPVRGEEGEALSRPVQDLRPVLDHIQLRGFRSKEWTPSCKGPAVERNRLIFLLKVREHIWKAACERHGLRPRVFHRDNFVPPVPRIHKFYDLDKDDDNLQFDDPEANKHYQNEYEFVRSRSAEWGRHVHEARARREQAAAERADFFALIAEQEKEHARIAEREESSLWEMLEVDDRERHLYEAHTLREYGATQEAYLDAQVAERKDEEARIAQRRREEALIADRDERLTWMALERYDNERDLYEAHALREYAATQGAYLDARVAELVDEEAHIAERNRGEHIAVGDERSLREMLEADANEHARRVYAPAEEEVEAYYEEIIWHYETKEFEIAEMEDRLLQEDHDAYTAYVIGQRPELMEENELEEEDARMREDVEVERVSAVSAEVERMCAEEEEFHSLQEADLAEYEDHDRYIAYVIDQRPELMEGNDLDRELELIFQEDDYLAEQGRYHMMCERSRLGQMNWRWQRHWGAH